MAWKLHNAMWPGLVGKEEGSAEPPISLDRMLELTTRSEVEGKTFDGVDLFLYQPHLDIDASDAEIRKLADKIANAGLKVGSVVAPIWPDTEGGSAMGSADERTAFVNAVRKGCQYAKVLREHGVREYGSIRIDSACGVEDWAKDPVANTKLIAQTFTEAAKVAEEFDEVLVAEGEICWGGMHSWKDMLDLLEAVGLPGRLGFQADLAHTYLYLLGYNAEEHRLLSEGHSEEEFESAYAEMTSKLAPWTYDFHVAQNDGTVHGTGAHDKTGRHCPAKDPNGKLDIVKCAKSWLLDEKGNQRPEIQHICWDGCMFPNSTLEQQQTWNDILAVMVDINQVHG
ncbi:TIM barrel protein [Roseibacillus persicicus]|uniref:TIM barrel protein n=1 Tax=Roseibacillus persicicus TaxID=454148 RepID=UPI0028108818|nr:TIM barrel protein [Roseibacillus persicicus]MDQ8190419.1 TIM barrel protein [Roseibacillus persicicus]